MACSPFAVREKLPSFIRSMMRSLSRLPAELLEVDVGVEVPALLQLPQPREDLVHVAGGHQQQVVEQAHQVREAPEQRLERLVPLGVLEPHVPPQFGPLVPMRSNMLFSMSR